MAEIRFLIVDGNDAHVTIDFIEKALLPTPTLCCSFLMSAFLEKYRALRFMIRMLWNLRYSQRQLSSSIYKGTTAAYTQINIQNAFKVRGLVLFKPSCG